MREFEAFSAVTRRALSIHYVCPLICELLEASGSGSGAGIAAVLEQQSVDRKPGPGALILDGTNLQWSTQPFIFAFVIYIADSADGPFSILTSNVTETHFDLTAVGTMESFQGKWAKVTGIEPDVGETLPSPTIQILT